MLAEAFAGFTLARWEEVETLFIALNANGQLLFRS